MPGFRWFVLDTVLPAWQHASGINAGASQFSLRSAASKLVTCNRAKVGRLPAPMRCLAPTRVRRWILPANAVVICMGWLDDILGLRVGIDASRLEGL